MSSLRDLMRGGGTSYLGLKPEACRRSATGGIVVLRYWGVVHVNGLRLKTKADKCRRSAT